jgi:hypothetical protein
MIATIVTNWLVLKRFGLDCFCGFAFWFATILSGLAGTTAVLTSAGDTRFAPQNPQYLASFRTE